MSGSINVLNGRRASLRSSNFNYYATKLNRPQPVIDLVVAMLAIPSLVIFALLLEANMTSEWAEQQESRWTVLGLGFGLLLVSLIVCGYVTHRMGVCLWAGPQDDPDSYNNMNNNQINTDGNMDHFIDILPPSYESVMGFDVPPPPYHCIVKLESEKYQIPEETSSHI